MPKSKKQNPTRKRPAAESDGSYFLKLVLYVIVGSQWVWLTTDETQIPLPIGFVVGLLFASHDHFQIDRKIEYAILLIAALVAFWTGIGIFIQL
jgi:hypothetical protein